MDVLNVHTTAGNASTKALHHSRSSFPVGLIAGEHPCRKNDLWFKAGFVFDIHVNPKARTKITKKLSVRVKARHHQKI